CTCIAPATRFTSYQPRRCSVVGFSHPRSCPENDLVRAESFVPNVGPRSFSGQLLSEDVTTQEAIRIRRICLVFQPHEALEAIGLRGEGETSAQVRTRRSRNTPPNPNSMSGAQAATPGGSWLRLPMVSKRLDVDQ